MTGAYGFMILMTEIVMTNQLNTKVSKAFKAGWLVWGLAALFFFLDYMARVSPSVMHHYLQVEFGINEAQFGILIASFYIPYIVMQIPVGLMVDRFSIKLLLTAMSLLTALGCSIFGVADNLWFASIGRMLIGFSAAFAFISALRLATAWFPPQMLGLLAGLTQALGMLGAATGQAPVSFLVQSIGWRHSMLVMAFLFIILAAFIYQYVRDNPQSKTCHPSTDLNSIQKPHSLFQSLRIVLSSKWVWLNALFTGFLYAPTAVIGESIGAAYLQYGQDLEAHAAACAIGLIFIGWTIGGPLAGWLSDQMGRRKPMMIFSALSGAVLMSWIVFSNHYTANQAYLILFLFGLTNTGVGVAYALSTELLPREVVGTTLAFTNMLSIFVGALLQPIVGLLVDHVAGSRAFHVELLHLSDFRFSLILCPICSIVALLLALFMKETYCNPLKKRY